MKTKNKTLKIDMVYFTEKRIQEYLDNPYHYKSVEQFAKHLFEAQIDFIKERVKNEMSLSIRGFGTLKMANYHSRGRNILSGGEELDYGIKRKPKFIPSKNF